MKKKQSVTDGPTDGPTDRHGARDKKETGKNAKNGNWKMGTSLGKK